MKSVVQELEPNEYSSDRHYKSPFYIFNPFDYESNNLHVYAQF